MEAHRQEAGSSRDPLVGASGGQAIEPSLAGWLDRLTKEEEAASEPKPAGAVGPLGSECGHREEECRALAGAATNRGSPGLCAGMEPAAISCVISGRHPPAHRGQLGVKKQRPIRRPLGDGNHAAFANSAAVCGPLTIGQRVLPIQIGGAWHEWLAGDQDPFVGAQIGEREGFAGAEDGHLSHHRVFSGGDFGSASRAGRAQPISRPVARERAVATEAAPRGFHRSAEVQPEQMAGSAGGIAARHIHPAFPMLNGRLGDAAGTSELCLRQAGTQARGADLGGEVGHRPPHAMNRPAAMLAAGDSSSQAAAIRIAVCRVMARGPQSCC